MARHLISGDATIKAIKPGDSRKRLSDGDGLYLLLFVKGGAHGWRLDYAFKGRRKTLSMGTYPDTGLSLARRKADEARKLLSEGTDPSDMRKAGKAADVAKIEAEKLVANGQPLPGTFEAVAREWLDTLHGAKVSEVHAERTLTRFQNDIFPWLGSRPIGAIEAPELLQCLRRIEARGAIETAHRARYACGQVFRYGITTGHCKRDPAADLRDAMRPVQSRHLAAIVDPVQAGDLLRAMMAYQGHAVTRAALSLSAMLLLRPGELRHMAWSEIDLDNAVLTIPAARMKHSKADKVNGPPHVVPLAPQAVAVLRDLQPLTGHGRYVFPAMTTGERCMSENTVRSALRRLGYGNDDMSAHGFRAMARTMIAERLGIAPEVIEAQLAHAVTDALGRAYNRTQFLEQRRDMMARWADYLDRLRDGAQVLPFKAKATS